MNSTKTKSRVKLATTPMYLVPEYRDPAGSSMPPWGDLYPVSEAIVRKRGLDPYSLMFFQIPDNSNYQKFQSGDIAMIDTSHRRIKDGMRYLIEHPQGARIRRCFVNVDNSFTLCPDVLNANYRPEVVRPESTHLIRVVGWVAYFVGWGD
jgi:phage repressor protein C with HTH and peptisase S24 domain